MPALLSAHVERTVLLAESGDADDVLAITWTNSGDEPADLAVRLVFDFRERKTTFVSVSDQQGTYEPRWYDQLDTSESISVNIEGVVEPHQKRVVRPRTHVDRLAQVMEDGLVVRDPLYAMEFPELGYPPVSFAANVVFPSTPVRRMAKARGASVVTGRSAAFDFGAIAARQKQFLSIDTEWRRVALPLSPRDVDDAIALLYRAVGFADLHDLPTLNGVHPACGRLGLSLPATSDLQQMAFWDRDAVLRKILSDLVAARAAALLTTVAATRTPADVLRLAENIGHRVEGLLGDLTNVPDNAGDVLIELLQYQSAQRQRSSAWSPQVKEAVFQERLHEFLLARGHQAVREPHVAGGRADILTGLTSIELKVIDLNGRPAQHIRRHLNQAAEYAASQGFQFGLMVILDSHKYGAGGAYLPRGEEQVDVAAVISRPGAAESSTTVVVTIVVPAFLPKPSGMGRI